MHYWGSWPDEMFNQVEEAASEIGTFCARWGRIGVRQTKEKFGTARVYCSLGVDCLYGLVFPRHCWIKPWWPYKLDLLIMSSFVCRLLNIILLPYQRFIYKLAYKRAVKKYPHLWEEILVDADFGSLLNGIAGYKYSDYWKEIN